MPKTGVVVHCLQRLPTFREPSCLIKGYSSMAVDGRDTRAVEPQAKCSSAIFERSKSPSKSSEVELQKRVDATIEKVLKLWRREGDV